MIGIDLVHIPSFAEQLAMPGSRFEQVFSVAELRVAHAKPDRATYLAGRWAAKEAFIKAWDNTLFGHEPRINTVNWSEISVDQDRYGRTRIVLSGAIRESCEYKNIPVSISHDGEYATAIVQLPLN
ncbi:MAG: holo-ACP synthase [Corynebacterium sp.]|nr:holo-ACP synthase [Corynebacterium sp.]